MLAGKFFAFVIIAMNCFGLERFAGARLVQEEVDALEEIVKTMGSTYWKFNADSCKVEMVGLTPQPPTDPKQIYIECGICNNANNTDCHVTKIAFKRLSLPGVLPPHLVKLPYLSEIDFAYNYINGTIPSEWGSMQLTSISLLVNRLSGEIPKELGNISTLTYLSLEGNQFSGTLPSELGKLINLETLILSSNQLTGNLPTSFAKLINLLDFRINDNNFNGTIPNFLQNWTKLNRTEMHASGLAGPIPSSISVLSNLTELRISDIKGPSQVFPILSNMTSIQRLVLRNCNLTGEIPDYLWAMQKLDMLDVSFNKLTGEIPTTITADPLRFIYLTGNSLTGDIPDAILNNKAANVDLSYNNLTLQGPDQPACQQNLNLNLNLFHSSSVANSSRRTLPCMKTFSCPKYSNCFHANCGGNDMTIMENKTTFLYEGDAQIDGGAAKYNINYQSYWGFSSTGDFMDDNDYQNLRYTVTDQESSTLPELYLTARRAPISLTYFHYCLENGRYTVRLHFAEIQFTNDKTYKSLGRRIFDIYVQESLMWEDFNIEDQVGGAQKPLVKTINNVSVTNNALEIRFYFAGKGTTRIPDRGVYGPIISAISVVSDWKPCPSGAKKAPIHIVGGVIGAAGLIFIIVLGILWCKGYLPGKGKRGKGNLEEHLSMDNQEDDLELPHFDLTTIANATNNFSFDNMLGKGGFGFVYKGILENGQEIAVKRLSKSSRQGLSEFKNEVKCIAKLQHRNLVKLLGYCIQLEEKMLIYEYMPNKSVDFHIFDQMQSKFLDWPKRFHIVSGISRGLLYLHQDSRLRIIHRDLKLSNVLLDNEMNPKISDFGMARIFGSDETEANTKRVVGTYGYMSPEYAIDGLFSTKSDVFSFGVLVLEIVSGKINRKFSHPDHQHNLLGHAWRLFKEGRYNELIDAVIIESCNLSEVLRSVHVGLLCVQHNPEDRPSMSSVVLMLGGEGVLREPKEPGFFTERKVDGTKSELCSVNEVTVTTFEAR